MVSFIFSLILYLPFKFVMSLLGLNYLFPILAGVYACLFGTVSLFFENKKNLLDFYKYILIFIYAAILTWILPSLLEFLIPYLFLLESIPFAIVMGHELKPIFTPSSIKSNVCSMDIGGGSNQVGGSSQPSSSNQTGGSSQPSSSNLTGSSNQASSSNQAGSSNQVGGSSQVGGSRQTTALATSGLDERIIYTEGFADPQQRAVRDQVIANGYNPAQSNQPYAKNLANKLEEMRTRKGEAHSQMPANITPQDEQYMDVMIRVLHPNYNPNAHLSNSRDFRRFLKKLP